VFNALNLMFEAENSPFRWKLMMNGNRPTVLLRFLPELLPHPAPPEQIKRKVFYVGDLLGDEASGRMTIEQLLKTINDVYRMSFGEPKETIKFHKEAQLLVISGWDQQLDFIQQTIAALQQKAGVQHGRRGGYFSPEMLHPPYPPSKAEPKEPAKETQSP
jgi:hypothetical protein